MKRGKKKSRKLKGKSLGFIYIDEFRCEVRNGFKPQNFHELFAYLVKRRRLSLKLSQQALADRIGISQGVIGHLETHAQADSTRFFLDKYKLAVLNSLGYRYKFFQDKGRVFEVTEYGREV